MENMRASPLEYVSMGTPVERGGPYPPYIHPVFLTPPPLASIRSTIVRFLYFPRLPPLYSGTRDPTVHYPTVPPPHSSLSLCLADSWSGVRTYSRACAWTPTREGEKGEREFIESAYVYLPPGIQLERAIGPNGMKFLCGQTQERSLFFFFSLSRPTPNHSPPPSLHLYDICPT